MQKTPEARAGAARARMEAGGAASSLVPSMESRGCPEKVLKDYSMKEGADAVLLWLPRLAHQDSSC